MANPHIRWMIRRDLPEILKIEKQSFPDPWTEEDFCKELRARNTIGMVAEEGDRVVGYMVYTLHKTHFRLLTLAVHPDHRRQGLGRSMLLKLSHKLEVSRWTRIRTTVRETNLPAQLLLRDSGFKATKVRRGFYDGTNEDAYEFRFDLAVQVPF